MCLGERGWHLFRGGLERRSFVARRRSRVQHASRGSEHLVNSEQSERIYLVIRDRARSFL